MQDLFFETITLQRIALFTRLVAKGECTGDEKELAMDWISEMVTELEKQVTVYKSKAPHSGGISGSRGGFQ